MNLQYVVDVYGKRHRVSVDDLNNEAKIIIPIYNQFGRKVSWNDRSNPGNRALHKENIAKA